MTRPVRWSVTMVALLMVVAVSVAGCSRGGAGQSGVALQKRAPAASPTATATATSPGEAAVAAYLGFWKAFVAAVAIPDPDYPDLRKYGTGSALDRIVHGIQVSKDQGVKGSGYIGFTPRVLDGTPEKITIRDCWDTTHSQVVHIDTGAPVEGDGGGRRMNTSTLTLQINGRWKVSEYSLTALGSC
jgi:hypothetical protein